MGLLDKLKGKQPTYRHQRSSTIGYASKSEEPIDVALSPKMQFYTDDELTRALGAKIDLETQILFKMAKRDVEGLPNVLYVLLNFPDGTRSYAPLSAASAMEDAIKAAGIEISGLGRNARSVDALNSLAESYTGEIEGMLPITGAYPGSEAATYLREALIGYVKSKIMPVFKQTQLNGREVLDTAMLEQKVNGMQPYQPGAK